MAWVGLLKIDGPFSYPQVPAKRYLWKQLLEGGPVV